MTTYAYAYYLRMVRVCEVRLSLSCTVCDMTTNGKQLTLINIYAPNDDNPTFFTSVFEHLDDFKCDEIIIGGDYNLVLDIENDKKGGLAKTHKK